MWNSVYKGELYSFLLNYNLPVQSYQPSSSFFKKVGLVYDIVQESFISHIVIQLAVVIKCNMNTMKLKDFQSLYFLISILYK
jgi:hypothetical protein